MHTLVELKRFLETHVAVTKDWEYTGWFLKIRDDTWTMLNDEYYCNDVKIHRKEILNKYIDEVNKKKQNRIVKKISKKDFML